MQKIVYVQSNAGNDGLEEVNKILAEGIWKIGSISPCALSDGASSAYIILQRQDTKEEYDRGMEFMHNQLRR